MAAAAPPPRPAPAAAAPAPEPEPSYEYPRPPRSLVRAAVPEVFVARTVWHPERARRVALVEVGESGERREVHEGDVVGQMLVERISPSGVYFEHDGVAVLRRVGSR